MYTGHKVLKDFVMGLYADGYIIRNRDGESLFLRDLPAVKECKFAWYAVDYAKEARANGEKWISIFVY